MAVDLMNTWDELEDEPDLLRGVPQLRRLLAWHGFSTAADALREPDITRARDTRSVLTDAFDARSDDLAVATLNRLVADSAVVPQLERDGEAWRLRQWPPETQPSAFLAAYTGLGLLEAVARGDRTRFGRCAGAPCRCVYVDWTRNRSRLFCCHLCADRVAQARLRERRRSSG